MFAPAPGLTEEWSKISTAGDATVALLLEPDSKSGVVSLAATCRDDAPAAAWGFIATTQAEKEGPLLFVISEGENKWRFVSYVPDGTHPAKRMAYANARSCLKPIFGKDGADFQADYHVTEKEELTLAAMQEWADRSDREGAMSKWEKEKAAVIRNEEAEREHATHAAVAVVSVRFEMSDDLKAAVKVFEAACHAPAAEEKATEAAEGSEEVAAAEAPAAETETAAPAPAAVDPDAVSFIAVRVPPSGPETLELVEKAALCGAEGEGARGVAATSAHIKTVLGACDEPRFFLLRVGESAVPGVAPVLLYVCPEGIHPRLKMRASTAKAALVSACATLAGLRFARSLEASSIEDALEQVQEAASIKVSYPLPGAAASPASGGGYPMVMGHAMTSPSSGGAGAHHARGAGSPPVGAFCLPGMGGGMPMGGFGLARSPDKGGAHSSSAATSDAGADAEIARPVAPWRANLRQTGMALPGMGASPK